MTYPNPSDPVSALTRADGTTEAHSADHGRVIGIWFNPKHYGAAGDGIINDTPALDRTVADMSDGDTLYLPAGQFRLATTWTIDKRINVIGSGLRSCLWVDLDDTGTDAVRFDNSPGWIQSVVYRDFLVLGGVCKDALVFRNLVRVRTSNIQVWAGATGWAVTFDGCLINDIDIQVTVNDGNKPFGAGSYPANGVRFIDGTDVGALPPNANRIYAIIEGLLGDALSIITTAPDGGNNWVSGIIEGNSGSGLTMSGCNLYHIQDLHLEGSVGTNTLDLVNCGMGAIGPGVPFTDLTLTNCNRVKIDGAYGNNITIASDCEDIQLGIVSYGSQSGVLDDQGARTTSVGFLRDATGESLANPLPAAIAPTNLIRNGDFSDWTTGTPNGWTITAGSVAKTGYGEGDTTALFGAYCAKLSGANAAMYGTVPFHATALGRNRFVTATAWVYIPSGQGANQPAPYLAIYFDGGASTFSKSAPARTNEWMRVSLRALVPTGTILNDYSTSVRLYVVGSSATGNYYVDGASVVVGADAPATLPPYVEDSAFYRTAPASPIRTGIVKTDDSLLVGGNVGFYGTTPVARPSAYTQTYATADKTHAAPTAATLTVTDGAGTNDNTIGAITGDASVIAAVQELADEINKLVADVADTKQLCNSIIDDLQALGLVG